MSLDHKEMERWYRLKAIRITSQALVVTAVALSILMYAVNRYFQPEVSAFTPSKQVEGKMLIENFSYTSPGAHPWELKAVSAEVSDSLEKVSLTRPSVEYLGGKGGKISLAAQKGNLDKNAKTIVAEGDVKLEYKDFLFSTDEIGYNDQHKTAQTEKPVSLSTGNLKVHGKGLKITMETEEIVIEQEVTAVISDLKLFTSKSKLPL